MKQSDRSLDYLKRLHFNLTELLETISYSSSISIGVEFSEEDETTLDNKIDETTHMLYEYWKLDQPPWDTTKELEDPIPDPMFKPLLDLFPKMLESQTRERIFLGILPIVDAGYKEEAIEVQFSEVIAKSMAYTDKVIDLYFKVKQEEKN